MSLTQLPDWFIDYSVGRDSGVVDGLPAFDGPPRIFALQRLKAAPNWTLVVSSPLPSRLSLAFQSSLPALLAVVVLLVSAVLAMLFVGRRRALADVAHAAKEAAERELLLAEISASEDRKVRLMAVLAHDLRTPLVATLDALDHFNERPAEESSARALNRVQQDANGMLPLIDDVLELARLQAGELYLRPVPFVSATLINEVTDLVGNAADDRNTKLVTESGDLPPFLGDVAALRRILLNFATNAVKATRNGTIRIEVEAGPAGPDGYPLTFSVADTGRGISPEDIPRLFKDFSMLESKGAAQEGNGLCLAICHRLAEAMGGEVGVESTPGVG